MDTNLRPDAESLLGGHYGTPGGNLENGGGAGGERGGSTSRQGRIYYLQFFAAVALVAVMVGAITGLALALAQAKDELKNGEQQDAEEVFGCQAPPFAAVTQPERSVVHGQTRSQFFQMWSLPFSTAQNGSAVLLNGGKGLTKYASDTDLAFQQDSNFIYLTGVLEPDCAALFHVPAGAPVDASGVSWTLFGTRKDSRYAVWNGYILTPADYMAKYAATSVYYIDEMPAYLRNLTAAAGPDALVFYTLGANAFDPGVLPPDALIDTTSLPRQLAQSRIVKTSGEVALLRVASMVSAQAHLAVMRYTRPGLFEYQAEARFTEFAQSCDLLFPSYLPIVGSGYNSAILHYISNGDLMNRTDLLLIDAAYSYYGYTSDITRTYPVNGVFSQDQQLVYQMVLNVQTACIQQLGPGANFTAIMRGAKSLILQQLLINDFVNGSVPDMLAAGIDSLFMNHGLGHTVGLDVHDSSTAAAYASLIPGMVLTVEPGIYFNDALLGPALSNPLYAPFLVSDTISHYLQTKFGGVRIEDVVLISPPPASYEILSSDAPTSISAIQAIMSQPSIF